MEVRDTCEEGSPTAQITVTPLGSRVTEPIEDHCKRYVGQQITYCQRLRDNQSLDSTGVIFCCRAMTPFNGIIPQHEPLFLI